MADTLKMYSLICPEIDCSTEFDVQLSPEALAEDGDLITCPACGEEWEWEYDAEADTLQLLADEDDLDTDLLEDEAGEDDDED